MIEFFGEFFENSINNPLTKCKIPRSTFANVIEEPGDIFAEIIVGISPGKKFGNFSKFSWRNVCGAI